jgi:hypothetical protein
MDEEEELTEDDEIDGILDWAVNTFTSGGSELTDYTATLTNETLTSVSDGTTTITF